MKTFWLFTLIFLAPVIIYALFRTASAAVYRSRLYYDQYRNSQSNSNPDKGENNE